MKNTLLRSSLILATALFAHAGPILTVGTSGNSLLATPTKPSPTIGTLFNFDSLTPFTTFNPTTYAAQGLASISSPDGLLVEPFSTQSDPNELFDDSSDGSANIAIALAGGVTRIGIGVADSDPVSITLQALNASGVAFGSLFTIPLVSGAINPGNFYFELSDTTPDIFGLQILQSAGNAASFSGLAIDDLQVAPEPASFMLLAAGISVLGFLHWRRRA